MERDAQRYFLPNVLELAQKAEVALEEEAKVRDAVLDHRHPVGARAEGEAGVPLGVVADLFEDRRVHHPRAEHLQPARAPAYLAVRVAAAAHEAAYVQLDARLDELKVTRPQAHLHVLAKDVAGHRGEGALEVSQGEALVHGEAFYLVEHRGV